ncbi:isoprenylcysteine carboxylmethyltransferase family protein [Methanimicrococcus hacksteinii]|nr:isoprenylcysteine carboxylmethyltransferase family protein [Methanimicrococcus sp. At1]
MSSESSPKESPSVVRLLLYFLFPFFSAAVFFLLAGTVQFAAGWIFNLWLAILVFIITVYLWKKDPALLKERSNPGGYKNQKGWDKIFVPIVMILYFVWFFIMPLDVARFEWSGNAPAIGQGLGFLTLLISSFFLYRSVTDNTYLSPTLRIQEERNQTVITTGVYGFIRHPMYLGNAALFIGAPMLLGSVYGLFFGILLTVLLMSRIPGEEKMLKEELSGYFEYMDKVKYRLFPFIW